MHAHSHMPTTTFCPYQLGLPPAPLHNACPSLLQPRKTKRHAGVARVRLDGDVQAELDGADCGLSDGAVGDDDQHKRNIDLTYKGGDRVDAPVAMRGRGAGAALRDSGELERAPEYRDLECSFTSNSLPWSSSLRGQRARIKLQEMSTRSRRLRQWEGVRQGAGPGISLARRAGSVRAAAAGRRGRAARGAGFPTFFQRSFKCSVGCGD
jgi:hypothetical protein